jgi:hypothetical protein
MNRRTKVHRVIYDISQKREVSEDNTSRPGHEHFPSQNAKPLEINGKGVSNILGEAFIRERIEVQVERESAKLAAEISEAEAYLSDVSALASDQTTAAALIAERAALAKIADNDHFPDTLREQAARLRDDAAALR